MDEIVVYTTEDADGNEDANFASLNYEDAVSYARACQHAVLGNSYRWQSTERLEDFTTPEGHTSSVDDVFDTRDEESGR